MKAYRTWRLGRLLVLMGSLLSYEMCISHSSLASPVTTEGEVGAKRSQKSSSATKRSNLTAIEQPIPAPPPLIAPTGLFKESDMTLTPAQIAEREREYKSQADAAYARGDYRFALVSLQRAYLISKNPRYIANQGLVLEKMQRYSDAIKALKYYLLTSPPAELSRSAQQVIHRLSPEVKIETDPLGARVSIGREFLGLTPLTLRLIAGEHPLELTLAGYDTRKVTLFVIPGKPVFAQYKLDQSVDVFSSGTLKTNELKTSSRPPMNTIQSSAMILGGLTLGLSATSLWFTREAVIERDQATTRLSWELAQTEADLFSSITFTTASIGFTALLGGLSWWLLSPPESPRLLHPHPGAPRPRQRASVDAVELTTSP